MLPSLQGWLTLPPPVLLLLPRFWLCPVRAAGKATQWGPFSSHFCKSKHWCRSSAAARQDRGRFPLFNTSSSPGIPNFGCVNPPRVREGVFGIVAGMWQCSRHRMGTEFGDIKLVALSSGCAGEGCPSVCGSCSRTRWGDSRRRVLGHGTTGDNATLGMGLCTRVAPQV